MENPQVRVRDRISALPDAILCHILSLLPTLWAVRSSILSTRWKNLWTFVHNLDFVDDHSFWHDGEGLYGSSRFMTFVDHVLLLRGPSDVQKFSLTCNYPVDFSRVDGWICYAIRHNVVELDFHLYRTNGMTFEMPRSLFMCKTLVALALSSDCTTYAPPISSCFPSLKSLRLYIVFTHDYSSIEKLVSCCSQFPVLESLTIHGFHGTLADLNCVISSPTLKTLKISLCCQFYCSLYKIFINAPKLEILHLHQDTYAHYYLEDTKSVVKANIVLEVCHTKDKTTFTNRFNELLAGISNVKCLSLSTDCSDGCLYECAALLRPVHHYHYYWQLLAGLLTISTNLEHLVLENGIESGDHLKNKYWKPPPSVPTCLLHLKTISIRKFNGRQVERKVAKYLFKYGSALNKMALCLSICLHRSSACRRKEVVCRIFEIAKGFKGLSS